MTPYGDRDLGQYWLMRVMSDGTKPLPEPMLTYHQRCMVCNIYLKAVSLCTYPWSESENRYFHYNGTIMSTMGSQITSLTIAYSSVYSGADQRRHQNSASLAFVRGIHRHLMTSSCKITAACPVSNKLWKTSVCKNIHWVLFYKV